MAKNPTGFAIILTALGPDVAPIGNTRWHSYLVDKGAPVWGAEDRATAESALTEVKGRIDDAIFAKKMVLLGSPVFTGFREAEDVAPAGELTQAPAEVEVEVEPVAEPVAEPEASAETPRERKNRLARERRASKKAQAKG